jgi:hypothetical protein
MKTNELKYWSSGVQRRGKDFYTIAWKIKCFAFMIAFSFSLKYISFNIYKLV